MAYVLSLRPHSPLKRSFSDNPYLNAYSPPKDALLAPLSDITIRNGSACSLYTLGANRTGDWTRSTENMAPLTSQSLLDLVPDKIGFPFSTRHLVEEPRKRNCGPDRPPPSFSRTAVPSYPYARDYHKPQHASAPSYDSESLRESMDVDEHHFDENQFFNLYEAIDVPLPIVRFSDNTSGESHEVDQLVPVAVAVPSQPFRRWMSTLKRRHAQRWKDDLHNVPRLSFDTTDGISVLSPPARRTSVSMCRTSDSMSSSMDYVTAIKTGSMTVGSASIAPRSEIGLHGRTRVCNRSSNYSDVRRSLESHCGALGPVLDENAWLRSLQRRKVVEELISSEESYIADLKVLINDYFMVLTALPTLSGNTKSSIQQNISQILQLHEDLLADLHEAVPQADFTKSADQESYPVTKAKHIRFHSADIVPGRFAEHRAARRLRHSLEIGRSPDRRPNGLVTDTETAGDIAKIFNKHMKRFFTYEEYGAHWTTMSQDLTTMCKGLHGWQEYERGVEALQKVVASENNREAGSRKALSFPDLLIKPIQRVCKYPLLFDDLCRHTPVYDDPEAHAELEKALFRLQETIREVNKAKDDPQTRRLIEITWQLQDRLAFQEQKISKALVFRLLGHVLLCGALHVAYQTPDRIKGSYLVCVLYKSCLVLATASRFHSPYTVVASIGLANASIEESNNGRGIQCHTAPHTWKFVFEHGHRLHELIFSACSSQEEEVWKTQLRERIVYETHDFVEGQPTMQDMYTSISLDLKSLGPVFGHANSLVRRMSVHRAATLGSKSNMSQVIIKNTQSQKLPDVPPTFSPSMITRSQSHLSTNHVPTLAPRRAERIRLESQLEDVWTKDLLPFPGMSNRRMENQIRASANSVMRKLSMASIASNFSRRSPSLSNTSHSRSEDSSGSRVHKVSQRNLRAQSATDRRPAPAVVDFHTAPAAFLPTDFEVEDPRPSSRRRRLANRAIGSEHSNDKPAPKPKKTRRLSTHIINLPRSESSNRVAKRSISHGSTASALHAPTPCVGVRRSAENRRVKREEKKDREPRPEMTPITPSKKFFKSKSRIFNFFR
ncbi:Rho guanyl nucleotide exchange factor [Pyrenophora tritici-repentis]|nr:Rho guanyl nucleotide exchange factor [Pyrenophora tritici-repentis]KAI0607737.1 Rho guanyl nucleotide exchange factor [Pyrenophora tritici-repentis]KAI0619847.1 Rho guanyl nucleotide exchange factor [Pyrenophora tritici-repentis]